MRSCLLLLPLAISICVGFPIIGAQAQSESGCKTEAIENAPDTDTLVAIGRQCLAERRSNAMLGVAAKIENGFRGDDPNWRLAAQLLDEMVESTESLPFTSLGGRNWEGALSLLTYNFLNGNVDTGWPQDFELALKYQTRWMDRLKREQASQEDLKYREEELAKIKAALARSQALTWTYYGDLEALAKSNPTYRGQPLNLTLPERGRFTLQIEYVDMDQYTDPEDDPRYALQVKLYSRGLLTPQFAGVCLVLTNPAVPAHSQPRRGIWFEHVGKPPFRQQSGEFAGQYSMSQQSSWGGAWLAWPVGIAPRSVRYEMRPLEDKRLCPESM